MSIKVKFKGSNKNMTDGKVYTINYTKSKFKSADKISVKNDIGKTSKITASKFGLYEEEKKVPSKQKINSDKARRKFRKENPQFSVMRCMKEVEGAWRLREGGRFIIMHYSPEDDYCMGILVEDDYNQYSLKKSEFFDRVYYAITQNIEYIGVDIYDYSYFEKVSEEESYDFFKRNRIPIWFCEHDGDQKFYQQTAYWGKFDDEDAINKHFKKLSKSDRSICDGKIDILDLNSNGSDARS